MVAQGLLWPRGEQKVDRDHIGSLVEHLEERVLCIGAGLAPDDGCGGLRGGLPVETDPLAVRIHLELLDIGG